MMRAMNRVKLFVKNLSGTLPAYCALTVVGVSLASVIAATALDRLAREGGLPHLAFVSDGDAPIARPGDRAGPTVAQRIPLSELDDMPVGSISNDGSRTVVLNPCTGRQQ